MEKEPLKWQSRLLCSRCLNLHDKKVFCVGEKKMAEDVYYSYECPSCHWSQDSEVCYL